MNILIIDGGLQALSVARSLKKAGYYVCAMLQKNDVAVKSNFIDDIYITFGTLDKAEDSIRFLYRILNNKEFAVIIPLSDRTSNWLSLYKKNIEKAYHLKCAIPDYCVFQKANDKWLLMNLCENNNIPHPKTRILTYDTLFEAASFVGFPALIKPNLSVGARGITLVNNFNDLCNKYGLIYNLYGECTLQEYIQNDGSPYYNVMLYRNKQGEIINSVIIEIIRYFPVKGGSSSFCKTIESKKLVDICTRTLSVLNWIGFADFDIMKTIDGEYKIIEINPRVPASIRAAEISGVNFPDIIVKDVLNRVSDKYLYIPNKQLRYLGLDFMWFLSSSKRFSCNPSWFRFFGKDLYYQEKGAMLFSLLSGFCKICSPSFLKSKLGV